MENNRRIIFPEGLEKGNYELNILLLLSKNEYCVWQDFLDERLKTSPSTVSKYTRNLMRKGFIVKNKRKYKITNDGLSRLGKLESIGLEKYFPPDNIELNTEEKIIWMVNNNDFCQWRDFLDDRLEINQSTLSRILNRLIDNGIIEKTIMKEMRNRPIYIKTQDAIKKYRLMLKSKDLDPKTKQEERIKMIREISQYNKTFFEEYNIQDFSIKYRFNKFRFAFDYVSHKKIFRENERLYNLTLLFLSINHPESFPDYLKPLDFCTKYNFKKVELNYYISELLEPELSHIKIFQIETDDEKTYYFHEKEKLAKVLKILIQDYLEKKFEKRLEKEWRKFDYDIKIPINHDEISEMALNLTEKHNFVKNGLMSSLLRFLPGYIDYLEYRIEKKYEKLSKKKKLLSREFERIEYLKISMELTEVPKKPPKLREEPKIETSKEIQYFNQETLSSFKSSKLIILDLIKKNRYIKALNEINSKIPILEEIDKKVQFFEHDYLIDREHYFLRNFFYVKKLESLIKLENYESIIDVAIKAYDIDTISNLIINLIEVDQFKLAHEIFDEAIDPFGKLSGDNLTEEKGSVYLDIHAHFHNKIVDNFRSGLYEDSLIVIEKYLRYNPNSYEFIEFKIRAYYFLGNYEKAMNLVDEAIKKWPKEPKNYPIDWESFAEDIDEIVEEANEIVKGNEESELEEDENKYATFKFCHLKARLLLDLKRYDESLNLLGKIIKANPEISETYFLKSLNEYKLNELDKAIKSIDIAIQLEPSKDLYYGFKSDILEKLNNHTEALESINKAIELNQRKPLYLNLKAKILLFMNKHKLALKTINEAIDRFPEVGSLYETKSIIIYGDESEALKAIEKAEDLGREVSRYNKAQLLDNLGRYEEALETIEIEINEDSENYGNYDLKASILTGLNRFEEALKFREKSLSMSGLSDRDSGCIKEQILNDYATYLAEKGDKEKAIEVAKEAVKLSGPEWASDSYEAYGDIFMVYQEYEEALDKYEKAKKSHIPSIEVNLKIGICHFELGNYDEALKFLKIAKFQGEHSEVSQEVDDDGKTIQKNIPQMDVIREAENYIFRIQKRISKE